MYNKSTQNAISAISVLAEVYAEEEEGRKVVRLSSTDIATARNLQKPFVAKLLTMLAQAKLIAGAPGPGGGYALARPPSEITLYDISSLFERENDELSCPYGPGFCGTGDPCPMHDDLERFRESMQDFLEKTTLAIFLGEKPTWPN